MKDATKIQRKLPEEGRQPARCFAIIDLGTQKGFFNGKPKDPAPEIMICWELTKFMVTYKEGEAPQPITINQKYTYSSGERAKLPKILKSWGKIANPVTKITPKFLSNYVGQYCMLDIEHNEGKDTGVKYANIGNKGLDVKPFEKTIDTGNGQKVTVTPPKPFHEKLFFNLDEFSWDQFYKIPEFIQKTIRMSEEWPKIIAKNPEPVSDGNAAPAFQGEDGDAPVMASDEDVPSF